MGVRQVIYSDLSGQELTEETHARVVINDHPALRGAAVEIDVSTEEVAQLQTSKIDLVSLSIFEPNQPPRRVVLDTATFEKQFAGVDMEKLLASGRRVQDGRSTRPRATRRASGSGGSGRTSGRVDYTRPDTFGQLHRGRVTEEEARLVRENPEQASRNRVAQGHPPIDWDDPKERKRYGL